METSLPRTRTCSRSSSSSSESSGEEGWLDVDPGEENQKIVSLMDSDVFDDVQTMLESVRSRYGFDFVGTCKRLKLDFYGAVKLVNFVRRCTQNGTQLPDPVDAHHIEDDSNLQPVLSDDGLLIGLDDILPENEADQDSLAAEGDDQVRDLRAKNRELQEQLRDAQTRLEDYRLAVADFLDDRWAQGENDMSKNTTRPSNPGDAYWKSYATIGTFCSPGTQCLFSASSRCQ